MIFTYTPAGTKRLLLSEWYALEKWPHHCPTDRNHRHFIVYQGKRAYRCGSALSAESAQVSAMVFTAKPFIVKH
ncbi:hypothetical protein [Acidithiobacillus thiooxidans]|uniref:hypothetical protein n=1 Tax=Acidithiobacillus thiooxidans TaxID=930 RepID=UPI00111293A1|nr:hypothetical protein [Acidithiobacillus thiooxidans]